MLGRDRPQWAWKLAPIFPPTHAIRLLLSPDFPDWHDDC
jgi:hypothetical protein